MFRPRDSHDQKVVEADLHISQKPGSLRFIRDAFGNHVGIARFTGRARELCFKSTVRLEHSPLAASDLDLEDAPRLSVFVSDDDIQCRHYAMLRVEGRQYISAVRGQVGADHRQPGDECATLR